MSTGIYIYFMCKNIPNKMPMFVYIHLFRNLFFLLCVLSLPVEPGANSNNKPNATFICFNQETGAAAGASGTATGAATGALSTACIPRWKLQRFDKTAWHSSCE